MRVDPETTCRDVKKRAEDKIADIGEKLADLKRIKKVLERLVSSCKGEGPTSECPILEAMETPGDTVPPR